MANPPPKFRRLIFIGLACLTLAVRLPQLGERPMHTDEAVNAYITGQLLAGESYHYDKQDRHGPALYAVALPLARIAGAKKFTELNETTLRLGPVIIGALMVLIFATVAPQVGLLAAIIAAALWAIAPLPVYYSRYFIHETFFVAATLGFLSFGWRLLQDNSLANGILTGLCSGLMLACKETAVLSFVAAGIASLLWWWKIKSAPIRWPAFATALAVFLILVALLYSWGGKNWQGLADLVRSLPSFLHRAAGEGHEKPAWYYLSLLGSGWSGWPLLALTLVGCVSAPRPLLIYTLVVGALYSAIPYKTPWLALNLWLPISLLAGCGATVIWNVSKRSSARGFVFVGALALLTLVARDTRRRVFLQPADEHNPYAYAHTGEDLLRLPERMSRLATQDSTIAVIAADPWPLPWYLRKFPRVGFWQPDQNPGTASFYLTSPEVAEQMKTQLADWRPEFFGVRPGVLLILWTPPEARP